VTTKSNCAIQEIRSPDVTVRCQPYEVVPATGSQSRVLFWGGSGDLREWHLAGEDTGHQGWVFESLALLPICHEVSGCHPPLLLPRCPPPRHGAPATWTEPSDTVGQVSLEKTDLQPSLSCAPAPPSLSSARMATFLQTCFSGAWKKVLHAPGHEDFLLEVSFIIWVFFFCFSNCNRFSVKI
jgi:hypothetical protein